MKKKSLKEKLTVENVYQIMVAFSKKKQEEQIKEVDKKGLWNADLITVELKEYAKALIKELTGEID